MLPLLVSFPSGSFSDGRSSACLCFCVCRLVDKRSKERDLTPLRRRKKHIPHYLQTLFSDRRTEFLTIIFAVFTCSFVKKRSKKLGVTTPQLLTIFIIFSEGRKKYRIILQKLKVPEVFSSDHCEKEREKNCKTDIGEKTCVKKMKNMAASKPTFVEITLDEIYHIYMRPLGEKNRG